MTTIYSIDNGKLCESELLFEDAKGCFIAKDSKGLVFRSSLGLWHFKDREQCIRSAFWERHENISHSQLELEEFEAELEMLKIELANDIETTPKTLEEFRSTL